MERKTVFWIAAIIGVVLIVASVIIEPVMFSKYKEWLSLISPPTPFADVFIPFTSTGYWTVVIVVRAVTVLYFIVAFAILATVSARRSCKG